MMCLKMFVVVSASVTENKQRKSSAATVGLNQLFILITVI